MGLRETLNKKPGLASAIGAGLLVLGIVFLAYQFTAGGAGGSSDEAYFTTDDGRTYFADDATKVAPFDHDGKQAVRAYVFECEGGKPFVNHLERHTAEGKKMIESLAEAQRAGKQPPRAPAGAGTMWGLEIKKPGDKDWIPAGNLAKSGPMMQPKCPDGKGEPVLVVP
jgi:hypothetical protein